MNDWNKIREQDFPNAKNCIYLDHAAGGVISRPSHEAATQYWNESLEKGDFYWENWLSRKEEARSQIAAFINADPEEVSFVHSTSEGMNIIADLLGDDGDAMMSDMEFPASTVPWLHQKGSVQFLSAEQNKTLPENFNQSITSSTKTIVSSYVQYATGFKQDLNSLSQIAKEKEINFVVNCSQALGAFPVDVKAMGIDCLAGNSYKWMMAGYGGGVLYIRKDILKKRKPHFAGWRSVTNPDEYQNKNAELSLTGSQFEYGGPSFPNFFALAAACKYFSSLGKEDIKNRILFLTNYLIQQAQKNNISILSPLEPQHRSGIIILAVPEPQKACLKLYQKGIFVTPRGGGIRVAPHIYNNEEDINKLISGIKK